MAQVTDPAIEPAKHPQPRQHAHLRSERHKLSRRAYRVALASLVATTVGAAASAAAVLLASRPPSAPAGNTNIEVNLGATTSSSAPTGAAEPLLPPVTGVSDSTSPSGRTTPTLATVTLHLDDGRPITVSFGQLSVIARQPVHYSFGPHVVASNPQSCALTAFAPGVTSGSPALVVHGIDGWTAFESLPASNVISADNGPHLQILAPPPPTGSAATWSGTIAVMAGNPSAVVAVSQDFILSRPVGEQGLQIWTLDGHQVSCE